MERASGTSFRKSRQRQSSVRCALHPPVFQHRRSTRKLTPRASAPSLSELSRLHAEGVQIVHRDKRLEEKLGSNNPCPCGSGQRFKKCCLRSGRF
ncbi:MAG: SEC-C metal-binding domain-containing protein [Pirellulaceae bacterium]